jgi:hypothetical protein
VIHRKISMADSMADTGVVDQDAGVVVEKHGRGRPHGSKNKPKVISMAASSSASAKRRPVVHWEVRTSPNLPLLKSMSLWI